MPKFKNISDKDLTVLGAGIIKAGETVELPSDFHNANFQRVTKSKEADTPKNKQITETNNK